MASSVPRKSAMRPSSSLWISAVPQMKRTEAIYHSMTKEERKEPDVVEHRRRNRIAQGAGVQPQDVSQMIKQFTQARDMMRAVGGMGLMSRLKLMKGLTGGGLAGLGQGGAGLKIKKGGWQEKKDRNKKGKR